MREILFRAKRVYNGEWIYGDLLTPTDIMDIYEISKNTGMGDRYDIDPETIGQFTGLTDKNGNKIFEGDIVKFEHPAYDDTFTGVVEYQICEVGFVLKDGQDFELISYASDCYEVIGNKWDNPELLEAK